MLSSSDPAEEILDRYSVKSISDTSCVIEPVSIVVVVPDDSRP